MRLDKICHVCTCPHTHDLDLVNPIGISVRGLYKKLYPSGEGYGLPLTHYPAFYQGNFRVGVMNIEAKLRCEQVRIMTFRTKGKEGLDLDMGVYDLHVLSGPVWDVAYLSTTLKLIEVLQRRVVPFYLSEEFLTLGEDILTCARELSALAKKFPDLKNLPKRRCKGRW